MEPQPRMNSAHPYGGCSSDWLWHTAHVKEWDTGCLLRNKKKNTVVMHVFLSQIRKKLDAILRKLHHVFKFHKGGQRLSMIHQFILSTTMSTVIQANGHAKMCGQFLRKAVSKLQDCCYGISAPQVGCIQMPWAEMHSWRYRNKLHAQFDLL